MSYKDMSLCNDSECPKGNCKRYRKYEAPAIVYYFAKSPRKGDVCEMYISKGHIAPEGVKK